MNIYIGADHRGFQMKEEIKTMLSELFERVVDVGALTHNPDDDYPDFAFEVSKFVSNDPTSVGLLFCGSSFGITVTANKVRGIIATNPRTVDEAIEDKDHHGGNVLCISSDHLNTSEAFEIIKTWLNTPFGGGRHLRRIQKIKEYENLHCN